MAYHVKQIPLSADTTIDEYQPTYNFGASTSFRMGFANLSGVTEQAKALINVDLSPYLGNDLLEIIGLKFYYYGSAVGAPGPILTYLYKMIKPFYEGVKNGAVPGGGEDASTWNHQNYNGTVLWGSPGLGGDVDYDALPRLASIWTQNTDQWHSMELTEAYRDMTLDTQYGFFMPCTYQPNYEVWINSRENASNQPYFEIRYINRGERPVPGIKRVTADPLGARNSHHVRLYRKDDVDKLRDEVGLVLCDNNAEENFKAIEIIHTPQESLKTQSGATERSDFEPPYSSLEFDDWSLGRGFPDHNKQKNAYLDAKGMYAFKPEYVYPVGYARQAILGSDYMKLDYRLTEAQLGHSIQQVNNTRWVSYYDGIEGWGMTFWCAEAVTNCTSFRMEMMPSIGDSEESMPNLTLQIWEVTPAPPATLALINGTPDCYLPNLSGQVGGDMIMTDESREGMQSGVYQEFVWNDIDAGIVQTFSLAANTLYFVTIKGTIADPGDPGGEIKKPNTFVANVFDGNWYEWAQEIFTDDDGTSYEASGWCGVHWNFYITGEGEDFKAHFVELDRCLHVGLEFLNGDAGVILKNAAMGLGLFGAYAAGEKGEFNTVDLHPDIYEGDILKITEGIGAGTTKDWARIISQDDVDPDVMEITHQFGLDNADQTTPDYSKYVIHNSLHFFEEVTDPVIAHPITHMLGAMGALYVCFGQKTNVRRLRWKFNYTTGATTREWIDELYLADMMAHQTRAGNNWIWRIQQQLSLIMPADAVNLRDSSETDVLDYTGTGSGTEGFVGNTEHRINSYAIYGDDPHLWIFKEDKPYEVVAELVYEFRNSQMSSMVDSRNGRAAIQHDTYLHFAFHEGVERWHHGGDLLNHGPDVIGPAGMPWGRQGSFADFAGYGNMLVGAYDGAEDGYSSLLAWNGSGWTELYRAPQIGERILSCYVQSIDGKPVDWLWFSMGSKVVRLPISTNPLSHMDSDYYYEFAQEAYLDSSWVSLGLKDVEKYINKFKVVAIKAPDSYNIPADATIPDEIQPIVDPDLTEEADNGQTYYKEGAYIGWRTSPHKPFEFFGDEWQNPLLFTGEQYANAIVGAEANQIQFRVGITQAQDRYPIVIDTVVMDSIIRLPHKVNIRLQFRLRDNDMDRLEMPDPYATAKEKYDLLDEYTNQAAPVWVQLDAKFVGEREFFVDQGSLQIIDKLEDQNLETWVVSMILKEA